MMYQLHHNHSLKGKNTFGVDVSADLFATAGNIDDLAALLEDHARHLEHLLVIGEGSNILFKDDFQGLLLRPLMMGTELAGDDGNEVLVRVGAGENWDSWVSHATEQGWYGLENLSLIPGSVGSAPLQNIGAYGAELKDHMAWLEAWDLHLGKMVKLNRDDCRFGYRTSIFKTSARGRFIITHVAFQLSRNREVNLGYGNLQEAFTEAGGSTPADLRKVVIDIRNRKLPDPEKTGNAGSFFKNPQVDQTIFKCIRAEHPDVPNYPGRDNCVKVPAAWLIEKAGWKGKRSGNTGTWPTQPLVIVNYGGATGREILEFSEQIREDVDRKFGVTMEREVNVV